MSPASSDTAASVGRVAHGPWLVADIGGTNARFGWVQDASLRVLHVRQLAVADHPGPDHAARAYLSGLAYDLGSDFQPPRQAAFAVATAVVGDWVSFTNNAWQFSTEAVERALSIERLQVLNDFEALALSLPRLRPDQVHPRTPALTPRGTLAVIGPGTGLGVAGTVQTPAGWQALPGEGGHATLAPMDAFESELLARVRQRFDHVSAERLLSGIGLPVLHRAVAEVEGCAAEALTAQQITERGLSGTDLVCARTLETFCALLGNFAGNLALTIGARGGVYIGGGIVPRLGDYFFASRFRACFEAKGRFRSYLEPIPTPVIIDTQVALTGAAVAIERQLPAGP